MADAKPRASKRPRDDVFEGTKAAEIAAMLDAGSEKERPTAREDEDDRTAYVMGMPFEADEAAIHSFFEGCGADSDGIESIRLPRYQDTGRCMGYGHVVFESVEALERAMTKDGEYMGSRFVNVSKARKRTSDEASLPGRPRPAGCSTLFVKNVPYDSDEKAIEQAFARYGKVSNVRIPRWSDTHNAKGIAYVQFVKGESASAAVAACLTEPLMLGGRAVRLDYETGAPKGSFRTSDGKSWAKTEGKSLAKKGPGDRRKPKDVSSDVRGGEETDAKRPKLDGERAARKRRRGKRGE
jgi:nucleolin